ncbi:MAG TPA: XdhC family protein [Jatrophihabitans sp.]|jgi:xanthine dehydrogenase accessory factor
MYDISDAVTQWLDEGSPVHVAQVVATRGFSSRDPGASLAWTDDGRRAGQLVPAMDELLVAAGAQLDGHLAELTLTDSDAVAAGLSCGGVATVFVQNAAAFPPDTWPRLQRHEPICLVSRIVGAEPATTTLHTPADVRRSGQVGGLDVPRLFARGVSVTALTSDGERSFPVVALWPTTDLLVVGEGAIASALADSAALLGWTVTVSEDLDTVTERAAGLTAADAFVVLSHDRATDVPALAAALSGDAGYVGALGSRHTQAARREGLEERGVPADLLARIHGPAGLDIDAHTPAEIAVSIVAEVVMTRAGRSGGRGGSISGREGPVHTAGVQAPPPRH